MLLDPDDVTIGDQIGKGAFGIVHKSEIHTNGFTIPAAMKTPLKSGSENASEEIMATLISYDTYK